MIGYYLVGAILLGNINKDFWYIFEPADWIAILLFLYAFFIPTKKNCPFSKTYINKFYIFFFIFILFIPYLINYYFYEVNLIYTYFIIVRAWLASYIFYKIFLNELKREPLNEILSKFVKLLFVIATISAAISISRYFSTTLKTSLDIFYPSGNDSFSKYGRLIGTMGATNTAGNFFAIVSLFALYNYAIKPTKNKLIILLFFISVLILTMSYSSLFAFLVLFFFILRKKIKIEFFAIGTAIMIISFLILYQIDSLKVYFNQRIITTFNSPVKSQYPLVLPLNLLARMDYGIQYISLLSKSGRLIFGWGPESIWSLNFQKLGYISFYGWHHQSLNPYSENFYFFILNQSGLFGLVAFCWLFIKLVKNVKKIIPINNYTKNFVQIVVGVILLAAIGNNTLYYGSITELFGISLALFQITLYIQK
ncbi:MAG: hypothetical protein ACOYVE_10365 [Melioribacter sp.]|uniref:hypothetical protein n=1 Tax=Melioribacter sp. TaxID=2052167 RepID=UPI003BBD23B8